MRIDIISAIPSSMESYINASIIKKAKDFGKAEIYLHSLFDYTNDKHNRIDDYPYGGGSGMLIKAQPIDACIQLLQSQRNYDEIIFTTADGQTLKQEISNELSLKQNIIIIAGHYKGIDQRIRDKYVSKEISIGDFVLTGGELPALIIADSIIRLLPGVLGDAEAALTDSFQNGLLEPAQYTRPEEYDGMKVPPVLLSGNHKKIAEWNEEQSIQKTKRLRKDLLN